MAYSFLANFLVKFMTEGPRKAFRGGAELSLSCTSGPSFVRVHYIISDLVALLWRMFNSKARGFAVTFLISAVLTCLKREWHGSRNGENGI